MIEKRAVEAIVNDMVEDYDSNKDFNRDLRCFGLDSLDKCEILVDMETSFDVNVPGPLTRNLKSASDIATAFKTLTRIGITGPMWVPCALNQSQPCMFLSEPGKAKGNKARALPGEDFCLMTACRLYKEKQK